MNINLNIVKPIISIKILSFVFTRRVSLRPIVALLFTIMLSSQLRASRHPPAGAWPYKIKIQHTHLYIMNETVNTK